MTAQLGKAFSLPPGQVHGVDVRDLPGAHDTGTGLVSVWFRSGFGLVLVWYGLVRSGLVWFVSFSFVSPN